MNTILSVFGVLIMSVPLLSAQIVDLQTFHVYSDRLLPGEAELPSSSLRLHKPLDLAEVLAGELPEVSMIRKAGTSNDLSYRGYSQDNLSVLNDGRKIFCACANRMDPPASHIGNELIEAIQLQGGLFDLSRSGALAATLNVASREPIPGNHWSLAATVGDFGYHSFTLSGTGGSEKLSVLGAYTRQGGEAYEDGDGVSLFDFPDANMAPVDDYQQVYRDDASFDVEKVLLHGRLELGQEDYLDVSFSYDHATDVLYPGLFMDSEYNKTRQVGIKWTHEQECLLWDNIVVDAYSNEVDHLMTDERRLSALYAPTGISRPLYVLERGYFMLTDAESSVDSITVDAEKHVGEAQLRYGAEWLKRYWGSDNRLGAGGPAAGESVEIFNTMIPDVDLRTVGGYLQWDHPLGESSLLGGGLRMDHFEMSPSGDVSFLKSQLGMSDVDRSADELSASLYFRQRSLDGFEWYAGIGRTVRPPNPQELYINLRKPGTTPNWLGNPDLEPVANVEADVGFQAYWENVSFRMKGFYSDVDGYILPVALTPALVPGLSKAAQSYGQVDAEIYGTDASLEWKPREHWTLGAGIAWQRGRKTENVLGIKRGYLAEMPPLKGRVSAVYENGPFSASWLMQWADKQERVDESVGEYPMKGYAVHRINFSYEWDESLVFSLIVDNLMDKAYATNNAYVRNPFSNYALINEPWRWVMFTARWSWSTNHER